MKYTPRVHGHESMLRWLEEGYVIGQGGINIIKSMLQVDGMIMSRLDFFLCNQLCSKEGE